MSSQNSGISNKDVRQCIRSWMRDGIVEGFSITGSNHVRLIVAGGGSVFVSLTTSDARRNIAKVKSKVRRKLKENGLEGLARTIR